MPRIPIHAPGTAPEESRVHAVRLARKTGRLLNIHAGMAHYPVVIAAYQGISQAISEHGTFDARTRQAIVLAVRAGEVRFDGRLAATTEVAGGADTGNVPGVVWQADLPQPSPSALDHAAGGPCRRSP